ncbi:hypothetical protein SDC9_152889 [bioreactor metagenome]|uniref:Uncharacterized protein n=1 Tax=bioreactor metagenome TaxID=1076179 RepID=A0A645EUC0_9ZZZZ
MIFRYTHRVKLVLFGRKLIYESGYDFSVGRACQIGGAERGNNLVLLVAENEIAVTPHYFDINSVLYSEAHLVSCVEFEQYNALEAALGNRGYMASVEMFSEKHTEHICFGWVFFLSLCDAHARIIWRSGNQKAQTACCGMHKQIYFILLGLKYLFNTASRDDSVKLKRGTFYHTSVGRHIRYLP